MSGRLFPCRQRATLLRMAISSSRPAPAQSKEHELLAEAYRAFNARDIDAVLRLMHTDVDWPNGWEGGRVHGHEQVRDYWTRQWAALDPRVEPIAFTHRGNQILLDVHQVVRDHDGHLIADHVVQHAYVLRDGLIERMDIVAFPSAEKTA